MHAYMAREVDHPRRDRITGPIDRPNIRERDYHVKVRTGLHEQHCILCYARHAPIVVPQVPVYDSVKDDLIVRTDLFQTKPVRSLLVLHTRLYLRECKKTSRINSADRELVGILWSQSN